MITISFQDNRCNIIIEIKPIIIWSNVIYIITDVKQIEECFNFFFFFAEL
jgi:hypothetical protein